MATFSAIAGIAILGGTIINALVGASGAEFFSFIARKKSGSEHPASN